MPRRRSLNQISTISANFNFCAWKCQCNFLPPWKIIPHQTMKLHEATISKMLMVKKWKTIWPKLWGGQAGRKMEDQRKREQIPRSTPSIHFRTLLKSTYASADEYLSYSRVCAEWLRSGARYHSNMYTYLITSRVRGGDSQKFWAEQLIPSHRVSVKDLCWIFRKWVPKPGNRTEAPFRTLSSWLKSQGI